jgi:hypothetical protein
MDVDDLDLDDLLSALQSVASSSSPDSDDDMDPEDDPDNDNYDPDDADNVARRDDDGDDDEGDYSRRRTVMLLEKLNSEARWTLDRSVAERIAHTQRLKNPISKADQNMSSIAELREKTSQINFELKTGKQLAGEKKKYREASVALYLAKMSPEEKRERDEDMRRIAEHYSARYPDASSTWREDSAEAFRSKKLS